MKAVVQPALVQPAALKAEGRHYQLQLIRSAREHVRSPSFMNCPNVLAVEDSKSSPLATNCKHCHLS